MTFAFNTGVDQDDCLIHFSSSTEIEFSLSAEEPVSLSVINIHGEEIETPIDEDILNEGKHSVIWDATASPSGIYYFVLRTPTVVDGKKMVRIN